MTAGTFYIFNEEYYVFCVYVGNSITEKSLPLFLTSLGMQGEGGGLLRLCLQVCCVCVCECVCMLH